MHVVGAVAAVEQLLGVIEPEPLGVPTAAAAGTTAAAGYPGGSTFTKKIQMA